MISKLTSTLQQKSRKTSECKRCKRVRYPEGAAGGKRRRKAAASDDPSLNHRRGVCSDGTPQKWLPTQGVDPLTDDVPRYPQPPGIFTDGTHFHPVAFLEHLRRITEKVAECGIAGSLLDFEDHSFLIQFKNRSREAVDGTVYYRLFTDLVVANEQDVAAYIIEQDGRRWLRVTASASAVASGARTDIATTENAVDTPEIHDGEAS